MTGRLAQSVPIPRIAAVRNWKGSETVPTVTAEPATNTTIAPFLLRRFHSLTGIIFGLYVMLHLTINATLVEGSRYDGQPTVYQIQVDKIHGLPFLALVSFVGILFPIIYHTIHGFYVLINGR